MHNIAVLGIGNILLTDDGVGIEVVKRLIEAGIEPFRIELGIGLSEQMEGRVSVLLDYVHQELDNMLLERKEES